MVGDRRGAPPLHPLVARKLGYAVTQLRFACGNFAAIGCAQWCFVVLRSDRPQRQGLDSKRVILEKDTYSRTTNHRSFYTDLTRARDATVVVTDSVRRLARLVRSDLTKSAALDVVGSMAPGAIASEREHG